LFECEIESFWDLRFEGGVPLEGGPGESHLSNRYQKV
jgi:hypothetical protein